jgi:hypothetical protein
MISIDMECSNGHIFEGWFDSLDAFEKQNAKDMVVCPFCNDSDIRRILSPVTVKKSVSEKDSAVAFAKYQLAVQDFIKEVWQNSEDVGARFAAEALKMHYGVIDKRNIRGVATTEEEKILKEEGIDFIKIPVAKQENEDESGT